MEPPLATVDKAIDVLFELHTADGPLGVTALASALGLPKSSTHRLLAALRRRGLVEQDERGRYATGIALIALGLGVLEREPAVVAARPIIEREAELLGETFFVVAARAGQLVVLDNVVGTGFLRAAPRVGSSVPVHASAVGKLQLAFAPGEVAFDEAELEAFTAETRVSAEALREEVRAARERGWAANLDEWIAGLSVLAAPLLHRGRLLAHVALAAPSARVGELGVEALAERVCKTAERIGQRLEGGIS